MNQQKKTHQSCCQRRKYMLVTEELNTNANQLLEKIKTRNAVVGVVGLGYVGLPLAVEKAKAGYTVIGFDVQAKRDEAVNAGENYIEDNNDNKLDELIHTGKHRERAVKTVLTN